MTNSWFGNIRGDILAGITVAFALIPEAIAFAIIAGVDPMVGLYASFCIAVVIAFVGGRPGMISAATGAMALLMVTLVADHGVEYLFAATILTGIIQFILGVFKVGRFITFVPHSVMLGFVNALAILIFLAQLPHFKGASWIMYAFVAGTLAIIYLLPRITKAVPSALVAIIVMTAIVVFGGFTGLKTVGDMGTITSELPLFHIPDVLFTFETFMIILPYSFTLAIIGLLESLLTATIVDEMTETKSDKNREVKGQGIANVVTGFFGGMAGCAMIGQSVINVKSGGRGRLSTLTAGVFLLFLILVAGDIVAMIPMAALVGVMIMVSIGTFDWQSVRELTKVPRSDALIMIITVAIVVYTHDLSKGVLAGVALSAIVFGWKMARIKVSSDVKGDTIMYHISGQLFFASSASFMDSFDYTNTTDHIVLDFTHSHVWDQSGVNAIAKVKQKYEKHNIAVSLIGLNKESHRVIEKIGLSNISGH